MTKEELLKIPQHTRIYYKGTDAKVLEEIKKRGPASYDKKGLVVLYVSDHSKGGWNPEAGIVIRTWTTSHEQAVPEDWEVLDAKRLDLTRQREKRKVRYADRDVKKELDSFTETFQNMQYSKQRIDIFLKDIPLADKLRILTSLNDEQKAWFDLLALDPAVVIKSVRKLVDDLNENNGEPLITKVEEACTGSTLHSS